MPFKSGKDLGYTVTEIRGIKKFIEHLRREFGEYSVVIRTTTGKEIQISSLGRVIEMEGSVDKAIQSTQETSETIRAQNHFDRNSLPTRDGRFVEPSGHIGLRPTIGDEHNQISCAVSGCRSAESSHGCCIQLGDEAKCGCCHQGKD